jgi:hypothetical protein
VLAIHDERTPQSAYRLQAEGLDPSLATIEFSFERTLGCSNEKHSLRHV